MKFENIKELTELIDSSNLAFFELQNGNDHIKMDKSLVRAVVDNNTNNVNNLVKTSASTVNLKEKVVEKEEIAAVDDKDISVITAPMVGTFYSSVSPENASFVQVGDTIAKGKIICIIEAMKLMNEIESECNGVVVECLAKDGNMVEYGEPLFKVKGE